MPGALSLLVLVFTALSLQADLPVMGALVTEQDPPESTLMLFNSYVLSYFHFCDSTNSSVIIRCTYDGEPCSDHAETTNFVRGDSSCLQIAFLHRRDEVVNGTEIKLVIVNATTLLPIQDLSRMFVLVIINESAEVLSQCGGRSDPSESTTESPPMPTPMFPIPATMGQPDTTDDTQEITSHLTSEVSTVTAEAVTATTEGTTTDSLSGFPSVESQSGDERSYQGSLGFFVAAFVILLVVTIIFAVLLCVTCRKLRSQKASSLEETDLKAKYSNEPLDNSRL